MADDIFSQVGFTLPTAAPPPPSEPSKATPSIFESAGFSLPTSKGAAPAADSEYPVPGTDRGTPGKPAKSWLQQIHEAIDPATLLGIGTSNTVHDTLENAVAGKALAGQGVAELKKGDYLPTLPSADPSTWSPGGVLKTAGGALGMVMSPITGASNALVGTPVTALTGNPDIGDRASFVASSLFPVRGAGKAAEVAAPTSKAVNKLVDAIGPENVPALVSRLRENPRLSPADVSDPVRTITQGLIDPAQPGVQNFVSQAVKDRAATLPSAVNSAYTEAMGPAPDVVKMVQGLKDRATDIGKTMIEPAIENAAPIPIKPILRAIDKQIGSPEAIAGETPRIPLDPTQIKLLNIRQSITDGEMAPLNERVGLSIGAVNDAIKNGGMSQSRLADFTEARRLLNSARRGYTSEDDLTSGLKTLADKQKIVGPIDDALTMIKKGPVEVRGADFLHGIQSRLRETAEGLKSSSVGSERNMSKDLFDTRNSIVGAIDKASGGAYRPALAKYRDAKEIHEAFESGFDTLKNRSGVNGLEDRPEALKDWMSTATPEQVVARRLGTRADIDQKLRGVKNQALAGENITKVEYNQEKLRTLFGDKEANRLIRVMKDAQDEAATNGKLLAGSKTAETLAGQKALEVRKVQSGNPLQYAVPFMSEFLGSQYGVPGVGAAMLGLKGAHLGAQKLGQMHDLARNLEFAKNALATGPAREETINRLLAHPQVIRELKKRANALTTP